MSEVVTSIDQEIHRAEQWLLSATDADIADNIIRRLLMIIRFLRQDLHDLHEMQFLEDGWSDK